MVVLDLVLQVVGHVALIDRGAALFGRPHLVAGLESDGATILVAGDIVVLVLAATPHCTLLVVPACLWVL